MLRQEGGGNKPNLMAREANVILYESVSGTSHKVLFEAVRHRGDDPGFFWLLPDRQVNPGAWIRVPARVRT